MEALSDDFDKEEVMEGLSHVFGIAHICPVVLVEDKTFSHVCEELVTHMKEELGDRPFTFKVFAKRSDKKYEMKSPDICQMRRLMCTIRKLKCILKSANVLMCM